MEFINKLAKLGLSEKEAIVYISGLRSGTSTASQLARSTGIKRGTIYGILNELKQKSLCSGEGRNKKRKLFTMSDPNELVVMQNERDELIKSLLSPLRGLIQTTTAPKTSVYEGKEEVRKIYYDTIRNNPKKEIYSFGSADQVAEGLGEEWALGYVADRVKAKIPAKFITYNTRWYSKLKKSDELHLRQTKFISDQYPLEVEFQVYSGKVLFMSFTGTPFAILVENEKFYNSMKNIFKLIWNTTN